MKIEGRSKIDGQAFCTLQAVSGLLISCYQNGNNRVFAPAYTHSVRLAALDLGSNSFHALIADVERGESLAVIERAKRMPRIGEAIFRTGGFSGATLESALHAVGELVPVIERNEPQAVLAVATSAVREARNGQAFVAKVRARFGIDVQVISGDEEARLAYVGARAQLDGSLGRATLFDLGGGSLEVVVGDGSRILHTASAPIGVLRAMAEQPSSDPPSPLDLRALKRWAFSRVAALLRPLQRRDLGEVVLCAGTARALRSVARALRLVPASGESSHYLSRDTLHLLIEQLAALPLAARRRVPGLNPDRADQIIHGAVILASVLDVVDVLERASVGPRSAKGCSWSTRGASGLRRPDGLSGCVADARCPRSGHLSEAVADSWFRRIIHGSLQSILRSGQGAARMSSMDGRHQLAGPKTARLTPRACMPFARVWRLIDERWTSQIAASRPGEHVRGAQIQGVDEGMRAAFRLLDCSSVRSFADLLAQA